MPEPPTVVVISNIDELVNAKHRCSSSEMLTDIRIGVAETQKDICNMAACFQELNARLEESMNGHEEEQKEMWKHISILEAAEHKRSGSNVWSQLIIGWIGSVLVAIVVIIAAYLMSGGHIT